jgi:hypothetical protein
MFVVYQTLAPINGMVTSFTEQCDAKHNSIYQLRFYDEETKMVYSLEHKDSMEMRMVEFIHALVKKAI